MLPNFSIILWNCRLWSHVVHFPFFLFSDFSWSASSFLSQCITFFLIALIFFVPTASVSQFLERATTCALSNWWVPCAQRPRDRSAGQNHRQFSCPWLRTWSEVTWTQRAGYLLQAAEVQPLQHKRPRSPASAANSFAYLPNMNQDCFRSS